MNDLYAGYSLEELQALEQAATGGVWYALPSGRWVFAVLPTGDWVQDTEWAANRENDAAFVAIARNVFPALLAEIARLKIIEDDCNRIATFMRERGWL